MGSPADWIEPMRNLIIEANRAGNAALSNDFIAIKSFVKRNGTNRRLLGRKVDWDWNSEFEFLAGLKEKYRIENSNSPLRGREKNCKNEESLLMSGRQDSNLRPSGPKPDALPTALRPDNNYEFQITN